MEDRTGAIEVGKAADCVMVDMAHAATQPTAKDRRLIGALVWAGSTLNVDTVFVAGRKLLEGGRSTLIAEEAAMAEADRKSGVEARECPEVLIAVVALSLKKKT